MPFIRTGLKRSAANWVRLFVLVSIFQPVCADDVPEVGLCSLLAVLVSGIHASWICACCYLWHVLWIFALGFIHSLCWIFGFCLLLQLIYRCCRAFRLFCVLSLLSGPAQTGRFLDFRVGALAMEPTTAAERKRAADRFGQIPSGDRVALSATRDRRKKLLRQFQSWLWSSRGVSLLFLLHEKPADPEKLTFWLTSYGQELYKAGKAYGIFAETINSVAAARPQIRKQLTGAWDYAFSWLADEPFSHHPALPASVLLALMSVALLWGWRTEAAILGLTWSGILRIGETLQAKREDLVLPRDAAPGVHYALLKIREPKTRGRHAKHQAARVDPEDIVLLLDLAFSHFASTEKLWQLSGATLRRRFGDLMRALNLPEGAMGCLKPFDLSSLRPGGASHLLAACEDSEVVRSRGRWATVKTM